MLAGEKLRASVILSVALLGHHGSSLTVHAAPANDNFADRIVIAGMSNLVAGSNIGATAEPGEPDHGVGFAGCSGRRSVWWTWTAPVTGTFSISTTNSSFDTVLAVYFGSSLSNLTLISNNDDSGGYGVTTSKVNFRAIAGETYQIAVDGCAADTGFISLSLKPAGYPAPLWAALDPDGHAVESSDFRYKVVMLNFWETTCVACRIETPDFVALQEQYGNEGLAVVGISTDTSTATVKYFMWEFQINYAIAMSNYTFEKNYGPIGLPTTFIIDRENRVIGKYEGGFTKAFYEPLILPLLRGAVQLRLNYRTEAGHVMLSWPATEFAYHIESTDNLDGGIWRPVTEPVVAVNGENTVSVTLSDGKAFFRLTKP